MEKSNLISVIIPAYNAGELLKQCIENLLFQSYKNLEIIVVDDGSTDETAEIVKLFPSVKYIYQSRSGVSIARNTGIKAATGEYIHFMDADDLITLDFYEKMIATNNETEADLSCCGFYHERYPSLSQQIDFKVVVSLIEDKLIETNVCNYGACWRYLIKRSFLIKNQLFFDEVIPTGADRIFSLQAVYFANRIVMVPEVAYIYKYRKESITATKDIKLVRRRHQDRRYAAQVQVDFAEKHNFKLDRTKQEQRWEIKLLGIPVITKRMFNPGKVRWYLFGIPLFQKKEVGK